MLKSVNIGEENIFATENCTVEKPRISIFRNSKTLFSPKMLKSTFGSCFCTDWIIWNRCKIKHILIVQKVIRWWSSLDSVEYTDGEAVGRPGVFRRNRMNHRDYHQKVESIEVPAVPQLTAISDSQICCARSHLGQAACPQRTANLEGPIRVLQREFTDSKFAKGSTTLGHPVH